jgi:crotonobetainyl-CoA:carnitine CoA-transferase CaiB-like acyl-CoA transferase
LPAPTARWCRASPTRSGFSASPIEYSRPAPALGADTDEILTALDLSPDEIRVLRQSGVIG